MLALKKNNLYLAFLKRRSLLTESRYKNYKNKLTKILRIEKRTIIDRNSKSVRPTLVKRGKFLTL